MRPVDYQALSTAPAKACAFLILARRESTKFSAVYTHFDLTSNHWLVGLLDFSVGRAAIFRRRASPILEITYVKLGEKLPFQAGRTETAKSAKPYYGIAGRSLRPRFNVRLNR